MDLRKVSTPDVDFFQDDIKKTQEVFPDKTEAIHADAHLPARQGAYHSPDNQSFCSDNDIDLHLHAIQGAKGRYQLNLLENGALNILDSKKIN